MKTNVTTIQICDILSFAEKDLKIFWNQAHNDLTPFIQRVFESPFEYLIDYEDLFSLNPQGKLILDEFIKKHKLTSEQNILVIR